MNKNIKIYGLVFLLIALAGCASVEETAKKVWGSSTQALDEARVDALVKSFTCSYDDCFQAVLKYANDEKGQNARSYNSYGEVTLRKTPVENDSLEGDAVKKEDTAMDVVGTYDVFLKDSAKGHIVVMGIEGNVNTTEAGIFFTRIKPQETKVEISSLSTTAKVRVSDMVFGELARLYPEVQ